MFFKCFKKAEPTVFVNGGILIELFPLRLSHKAGRRDEFNINLNTLAGILHLLIRLGNILGIWQFDRHLATSGKNTIQAGDGARIAPLPQLDPEHNKPRVGIPAAHITDKLQFCLCMLVRMASRTV